MLDIIQFHSKIHGSYNIKQKIKNTWTVRKIYLTSYVTGISNELLTQECYIKYAVEYNCTFTLLKVFVKSTVIIGEKWESESLQPQI
jgi:hypothetical protein